VGRHEKLLEAIRNNPAGVGFEDLCNCAEHFDFELVRTSGSHKIFRHPGPPPQMLDLQPRADGKAKPYQVKQFLKAYDVLHPESDL